MTAHTASLINALTLIACSIWAYIAIGGIHWTPLIPGAFGAALLACYPGVKAENKVVAHIAAVLTLAILIALYMPMASAIEDGLAGPLIRSGLMVVTTAFALIFFIKSFRDARRARG